MIHSILVPLFAGMAMFLFGMKTMEWALHNWAGPSLERWLTTLTRTPLRGMFTGTVLTALLQSSSAITVIVIGLVNARILRFSQTVGIILGTNIGACLTTELIGASLGKIGLPLLIVSASIWLATWLMHSMNANSTDQESTDPTVKIKWLHPVRCASGAIAGFALVLLGIQIMQSIGPALQAHGLFTWFIEHASESLGWALLAGACVTALVHSSAAVIAIAMSLAAAHSLSPELGIAVTLGANIGTCVTAWMASIGGTRASTFVAWTHIGLNLVGALLFFPFVSELAQAAATFSHEPAVQIARAQTIFNVLCSLIALPLCYVKWRKPSKL
ncbi:Na/Pi symporter [Paenibacillus sp. N1-5-1-14]|uniref:Na/Pi cotransporter family protein n=1 Tax=Paenibacillus radicibacter TaxID=2972488 RepID=UPI002158FB28|nr:Na/Pi symporter [Paenibacillus radicibacter]MCR8645694.1 Na/Pi symporter [Paenibacillus radicibacter]